MGKEIWVVAKKTGNFYLGSNVEWVEPADIKVLKFHSKKMADERIKMWGIFAGVAKEHIFEDVEPESIPTLYEELKEELENNQILFTDTKLAYAFKVLSDLTENRISEAIKKLEDTLI